MNNEEPMPPTGPVQGSRTDALIAEGVRARNAAKARYPTDRPARIDWPLDLYGQTAFKYDSNTMQSTAELLDRMHKSAESMSATFNEVPADQRAAWHAKAKPLADSAINSATKALANLDTAVAQCEASLAAHLKPKPEMVQYGHEIRTVVRTAKVPLTELFMADFAVVSAVLAAPSLVSGMTPEQHSQLREHAARTFTPGELAKLTATQAHRKKVARALEFYSTEVEKLLKRTDPKRTNAALAGLV